MTWVPPPEALAVAALLIAGVTGTAVVAFMVVLRRRSRAPDGLTHAAVAAARRSPVARALAAGGAATRDDLHSRTGLSERRVKLELSGLRDLGMVARAGTLWELSSQGSAVLEDVGAADDPIAGAARASTAAMALLVGPADDRAVAGRTDLSRRQAHLELAALRELGVTECGDDGQWSLTEHGRTLLAEA